MSSPTAPHPFSRDLEEREQEILSGVTEDLARGRPSTRQARQLASQALDLVSGTQPWRPGHAGGVGLLLMTKQPHCDSLLAVTAIVARCLANSVQIHTISHSESHSPARFARALYPGAFELYTSLPSTDDAWAQLAQRFDVPEFETVFGQPYSPDLVVPADSLVRDSGLTLADVMMVWEEGRTPITDRTLEERYGHRAAAEITQGASTYDWFHGRLPFGIQRLGTGFVAFAMRHQRVRDGAPIIVLNGFAAGLAALFEGTTFLVDLSPRSLHVPVGELRSGLVGEGNDPLDCRPGSIRHDAHEGRFPVASDVAVDSRRNVVHTSDGWLSGALEWHRLAEPVPPVKGILAQRLERTGLDDEEIATLVLKDPLCVNDGKTEALSNMTRDASLADVVDRIHHFVPPVFSAANGYASGVSVATFLRWVGRLQDLRGRTELLSPSPALVNWSPPDALSSPLHEQFEEPGVDRIRSGGLGVLIPAGGTSGRFGGYDRPESDPSRQKGFTRVLDHRGVAYAPADIRLANVVHWRERLGCRLPVAVMASSTSVAAVHSWIRALAVSDVGQYVQHGVYRLDCEAWSLDSPRANRWIDAIFRNRDGTPSLKTPGHLGLVCCLALSGVLDDWLRRGVRYACTANVDDVGFRIDPRIIGLLEQRPDVDAILTGVALGFNALVEDATPPLKLRGDVSGYIVDQLGRRGVISMEHFPDVQISFDGVRALVRPKYDSGGKICVAAGDPELFHIAETSYTNEPPDSSTIFSTNQMYLRLESLDRVLRSSGGADRLSMVRSYIASQPVHAQRRAVWDGDRQRPAIQFQQGLHDLVGSFARTLPIVIPREGGAGWRGGYATIKEPTDIPFAQLALDRPGGRDELALERLYVRA